MRVVDSQPWRMPRAGAEDGRRGAAGRGKAGLRKEDTARRRVVTSAGRPAGRRTSGCIPRDSAGMRRLAHPRRADAHDPPPPQPILPHICCPAGSWHRFAARRIHDRKHLRALSRAPPPPPPTTTCRGEFVHNPINPPLPLPPPTHAYAFRHAPCGADSQDRIRLCRLRSLARQARCAGQQARVPWPRGGR